MNALLSSKKGIVISFNVVPGINDDEEHVIELAEYANGLNNVERVELLAYHSMAKEKYNNLNMKYRLENVDDLTTTKFEFLKNVLNDHLALK